MITNYFKIWLSVIVKTINYKLLSILFIEHLAIFFVVYYFTNYNLFLSFILLLTIIIVSSAVRIFYFYRKLTQPGGYDLVLLKPVNPLVGIMVYNRNPMDILFLLLILVYLKLRKL